MLSQHFFKDARAALRRHDTAVQRKDVGVKRGWRAVVGDGQGKLHLAPHSHVVALSIAVVEVTGEIRAIGFIPQHGVNGSGEISCGFGEFCASLLITNLCGEHSRVGQRPLHENVEGGSLPGNIA